MSTSEDIALAVEQLRAVIDPMGWSIVAQDQRGEDVVLSVVRAKSTIGVGGAHASVAPAQSLPAGT